MPRYKDHIVSNILLYLSGLNMMEGICIDLCTTSEFSQHIDFLSIFLLDTCQSEAIRLWLSSPQIWIIKFPF